MRINAPMLPAYAFAACCALSLPAAAAPEKTAAPARPASWTEPLTGMEFVSLPKGCFQMGSERPVPPPFDSHWERMGYKGQLSEDEVPRHEVCVDAFWLAKTEVTEAQWYKVMGGPAPAGEGRRAKVDVTWLAAQEYVERLTAQSGGRYRFRLPTEAEWEYACRAGDKAEGEPERQHYADKAWYRHSPKRSYEVREAGVLKPNAFGLHDMMGNAWEWTQDSYAADAYTRHALFNPRIDVPGAQRVIRGGSFRTELAQMRCAMRGRLDPDEKLDAVGLRVVRQ